MLVPFIFVEILARILFPPATLIVIPSQNFRLIYELNPLCPEINSLGMRQEELAPAALHDNFVIAVIGDSHTYSSRSAKRGDSFPARLEHHLKALTGKKSITVLNLGCPVITWHKNWKFYDPRRYPLSRTWSSAVLH
jgi:hypothetical protein